jgi:hypothetical protein
VDRHRRARLVLVGVAVVLFAGPYQPSYAGNTFTVTLTWSCGQGPVWSDGSRQWVAELPVHGELEHDPAPAPVSSFGPPVSQSATGRLHFVSASKATFTSDVGGWFVMRRLPPNTFMSLGCSLGRWPGP